ncbi:MAG TPA: MerR family transcriptional regulator [Mycobacteriales bacterium]|nr:MerR family transcriptional regulator [Mycobacteriales bacterium]
MSYLGIGEVSTITGLSLRSIRYYEEVGLVVPSAHTKGGHRLYTDADIGRLRLIMKMKPLDFSLHEMGLLLQARDAIHCADTPEADRAEAMDRLALFADLVEQRWQALQEQLAVAEAFREQLAGELAQGVNQPRS